MCKASFCGHKHCCCRFGGKVIVEYYYRKSGGKVMRPETQIYSLRVIRLSVL